MVSSLAAGTEDSARLNRTFVKIEGTRPGQLIAFVASINAAATPTRLLHPIIPNPVEQFAAVIARRQRRRGDPGVTCNTAAFLAAGLLRGARNDVNDSTASGISHRTPECFRRRHRERLDSQH